MDEFEKDFDSLKQKMEIAFNEYIFMRHNDISKMTEGFNEYLDYHSLKTDIDYIKDVLKRQNHGGYVGDTGADLILAREKLRFINAYISKVNQAIESEDGY